jgi:hypothetical protein
MEPRSGQGETRSRPAEKISDQIHPNFHTRTAALRLPLSSTHRPSRPGSLEGQRSAANTRARVSPRRHTSLEFPAAVLYPTSSRAAVSSSHPESFHPLSSTRSPHPGASSFLSSTRQRPLAAASSSGQQAGCRQGLVVAAALSHPAIQSSLSEMTLSASLAISAQAVRCLLAPFRFLRGRPS